MVGLVELEQVEVFNEVLDAENICEFSSVDDSIFDNDYAQLATQETRVNSDIESDKGSDE
jgi:hypothetical protein